MATSGSKLRKSLSTLTLRRNTSETPIAERSDLKNKKSIAASIRTLFTRRSDEIPSAGATRENSAEEDPHNSSLTLTPETTRTGTVPRTATGSPVAGPCDVFPESQGKFLEERVTSQPQEEYSYVPDTDGMRENTKVSQVRAKGGIGGFSVRDRVNALEAKGREQSAPAVAKDRGAVAKSKQIETSKSSRHGLEQEDDTKTLKGTEDTDKTPKVIGQKSSTPIVYPLHYKRFVRRTSSGTPVRPETPLYRSKPHDEPMIHAPRPTKSIPIMKSPAETPMLQNASNAGAAFPRSETTGSKEAREGITPLPFLQGTKTDCVRHGRKMQPAGTKDMIKSRSGAYHPVGLTRRRQMDATSPWIIPNRPLTCADASRTSADSDVCPDCVTELHIKRRELLNGSVATVKRPMHNQQSTVGSRFTGSAASMTQHNLLPGSISDVTEGSEEPSLITTKDLGEGVNAIVVEHKGDLRRIVVNARHGKPTVDTMQRLSRELANVSNSIAFAGVHSGPNLAATSKSDHGSSVVVDTRSRARTPSVPELLDMIDQATDEIHLTTGEIAEHYVSRRDFAHENSHSLFFDDESNDISGGDAWHDHGLVARQDNQDRYPALHEHLATGPNKSSVPPITSAPKVAQRSPTSNTTPGSEATPRVANTPLQSPQPATSSSNIPKLVKTRPTLPQLAAPKSQITPTQTPPPEHPSLHHAVEFSDISKPPTSTSRPLQASHTPEEHHNHFGFLNPFRAQTQGQTQATRRPPISIPPSPTAAAFPIAPPQEPTTPNPLLQQNKTSTPFSTPPPTTPAITTHPSPYHHAPYTPLDLNSAAYLDPKLREQRQVIRAAMRMERVRTVEKAAAAAAMAEREGGRMRVVG